MSWSGSRCPSFRYMCCAVLCCVFNNLLSYYKEMGSTQSVLGMRTPFSTSAFYLY